MTKSSKLKIVTQTSAFYLLGAAISGSLYRFEYPQPNDTVLKLIGLNVVLFTFAFLFTYLGYRTAIKKGQIDG